MAAGETRRESGAWKSKHARILQAALDEFIARGFNGASMDRIALKAKVSKVTIYNHFENKDLLYRQMIDYYATQVFPGDPAATLEHETPPRVALMAYGRRLTEVLSEARALGMLRLLRSDPQNFETNVAAPELRLLPSTQALADYLEAQARRGVLTPMEPVVAARQLNGLLLETMVYPMLFEGPQTTRAPDEVAKIVGTCIEMFLRHYTA